ncbi:MAG TPA: response regulator transcription factor [Solirubrobacteraceae bacterium]|nr:response regulator transcription factor [Solirubrobacteraceae bacterium]
MRILLVEDDDAFASALCDGLGGHGHRPTRVATGREMFAALKADERPDLVLLDLGLPDADGLALCAKVRRRFSIPVIVVTARGDLSSRVQGLHGGADDYVVKPFALAELLARMEAVMRRAPVAPAAAVQIGDLTIDAAARVVEVAGRPVALTRKEFDLLAALARTPGSTVHRDRLLLEVWHSDYGALSRTLDVHIATLRAKLGRAELIETVRGVGYRLAGPS